MRAEHTIEPRDVWKVCQWKHDVDVSEPWWRRAYFRFIFIPFLNFSFKLGIPAVKEVVTESDEQGHIRQRFQWYEDQGIFESAEAAEAGCLGERWGYCKLPFGRLMPPDSAQYSGTIFPRKKNSKKWARPQLSLIIKDRHQDEQEHNELAACLRELNHVLDRK